ncbi:PREDICTED: fibrinogen-like protein 1 [Drosophila arizonae]|uniref:Fibrinogen-like protein 1 n=1 Tax=Drosophila arizonae TaxID=7263 RepID=A0ABM1NVT2_DROAR|nr:PREDICTED: fibrinogen-like protein 1 [Drosophila arizonae]
MAKYLIALRFLLLSPLWVVNCERLPKTYPSLERQISALQTELENKDELIAMLRIKTLNEQERIAELEKKLAELKQSSNKCQTSSCLCKSTELHEIKLPGRQAFQVSCDSSLVDPGWTVILRRIDGKVDFNRNWREYQQGFGDLRGEFFIGLDKLHQITNSQRHELYIYLRNEHNETRFARYDNFLIADDNDSFRIKSLGVYSGDAGDAMAAHLNMQFSTFDLDNDNSNRNCADENSSGWWFNDCYQCNLNGLYNSGFYWYKWQRNLLKFAQVMIRPKEL